MPDGITHINKDVMFKVLSENYKNKSLAVYGLDVPKITRLLPSNYPAVTATEIHADTTFLLEDGSLLILEYESTVSSADFLKYIKYAVNAMARLHKEGCYVSNVIVAVIYTGDINKAPAELDVGALRIQIKQVFLSRFDTDGLYNDIKAKIDNGEPLADDDIMRLIVLPLTQPDKARKQRLIEDTIALAKRVQVEHQQLFIVAGILTATNKFIDQEYSKSIKEWIKMTKVARLFEEEKIEAVNEAVSGADRNARIRFAKSLLSDGEDILKVMKHTGLNRAELDDIQTSISA